jgi:hypothetical protein
MYVQKCYYIQNLQERTDIFDLLTDNFYIQYSTGFTYYRVQYVECMHVQHSYRLQKRSISDKAV